MNTAVATDFRAATATKVSLKEAVGQRQATTGMHPGVLGVAVAGYTLLIGALLIGFSGPADLRVAFLVIITCLAAFVGLPAWMGSSAAKFWRRHRGEDDKPWTLREFLSGTFEDGSGKNSGIGSLVLVTTVPLALAGGAIAMAIIFNVIK